jgi:hypothetical protein
MKMDFKDRDVSKWQEDGIVIVLAPTPEQSKRPARRAPWPAVVVATVALVGSLSTIVRPGPSATAISKKVAAFVDSGSPEHDGDYANANYWRAAREHLRSLPVRVEDDAIEDPAPLV